jgi:hypothetical protein
VASVAPAAAVAAPAAVRAAACADINAISNLPTRALGSAFSFLAAAFSGVARYQWSHCLRMILSENRCTPRIKCGAGFFRIMR